MQTDDAQDYNSRNNGPERKSSYDSAASVSKSLGMSGEHSLKGANRLVHSDVEGGARTIDHATSLPRDEPQCCGDNPHPTEGRDTGVIPSDYLQKDQNDIAKKEQPRDKKPIGTASDKSTMSSSGVGDNNQASAGWRDSGTNWPW